MTTSPQQNKGHIDDSISLRHRLALTLKSQEYRLMANEPAMTSGLRLRWQRERVLLKFAKEILLRPATPTDDEMRELRRLREILEAEFEQADERPKPQSKRKRKSSASGDPPEEPVVPVGPDAGDGAGGDGGVPPAADPASVMDVATDSEQDETTPGVKGG